jgi:hypothetical protein
VVPDLTMETTADVIDLKLVSQVLQAMSDPPVGRVRRCTAGRWGTVRGMRLVR